MNLNHSATFDRLLASAAAISRAGWVLLFALTAHHSLGQAAPAPTAEVRTADTTVTLESPEPKSALLQGAEKTRTPVSEESPSARLATILKIQSIDQRQERLIALGIEMGKTNPERGMQMFLNDFPPTLDQQTFGVLVLRHWAEKQPLKALEACQQIPGGERRAQAYSSALAGWASVAPNEAAAWTLENLSGIYRRTAIARIGKVWASTAPRKAANWALAYSSEVDQLFSLSEVMDTWADAYGQDAAEWSMTLAAGKLRDFTLSKAMFKWADYFPKTAAEWIITHPETLWLMPRVAARWGQHDPAAASAWLDKNVSATAAQESRQAMVLEWAEYSPRIAFEWAVTYLKGSSRELAFSAVFSKWASEYPQEALLSALKLNDEAERHIALASVFSAWCGQDMDSFSAWLKQQKPGIEKDIGIEQLADVLITSNPAEMLSKILTIQNPARLQRSLTLHYQDWKLIQPQAAEAWLKLHPNAVRLMTP
jgi:hypothetical protein